MATEFQKKVWSEIDKIPYGSTMTYKEIAIKIGKPNASRAVANACGKNPIPIKRPCHRVICSDGSIGGYSAPGGAAMKRKLLEKEKGGLSLSKLY
jgi:methylated-DNA-[protein]-cysteine S-methyltransferase